MQRNCDPVGIDIPDDGIAIQVENTQLGHSFDNGDERPSLVQLITRQVERDQTGWIGQILYFTGIPQLIMAYVESVQIGQSI